MTCIPDAPDDRATDIPFYELFDEPSSPEVRETIAGFLNLCFARALLEEGLDRQLRSAADISLAQHEVLYRLSLAPGGRLRMAELADMLLASKSGASRLVDRMAGAGLVARQSSAGDRRVVFAVLTPAGRATLVRSGPAFKAGVIAAFGVHLDDDDHRALRRILKKLLAAHGAWDVRRCEPPMVRSADPGSDRHIGAPVGTTPPARRPAPSTRRGAV
ncbi:MAG: MarR family winged helix-turn-helix transcriptional regulator [Acidimicrobiales bacterium]